MTLNDSGEFWPHGLMQRFSFGSTSGTGNSSFSTIHSNSLRKQSPLPSESETEREALEITLAELVVKCLHRLLYPDSSILLNESLSPEPIKTAIVVSWVFQPSVCIAGSAHPG